MKKKTFLLDALVEKLNGDIAKHKANIRIYLENPSGVAEHPDMVATLEEEVEKLAAAIEKRTTIEVDILNEL